MIKLVAVDMDGTFLNNQKEYNKERFDRLYEKMKEQQVRFVVASGNQYYQLASFFPEIASEISFVAENGALVISEDQELFCGEMSRSLVTRILHVLTRDSDIKVIMCGRKSAYASEDEDQLFVAGSKAYYHRLKVVPNLNHLVNDVIFKFALGVPEGKTDFYLDYFNQEFAGDVRAVTSGHGEIDLIIPGLHKANGLQILQDKWGIGKDGVIAFGDGGNDLEMLKHVKYGYAMKNASQTVKEVAGFEAPSNEDEGVLSILEDFLN